MTKVVYIQVELKQVGPNDLAGDRRCLDVELQLVQEGVEKCLPY